MVKVPAVSALRLFLTGNARMQSVVLYCTKTLDLLNSAVGAIPSGLLSLVSKFIRLEELSLTHHWASQGRELDHWNFTFEFLRALSPTFKILRLPFPHLTPGMWQSLPTSLQLLELLSCINFHENMVPHLPSGLRTLIAPSVKRMNYTFVRLLPRGLEHLELNAHGLNINCLPLLPPNLTFLRFTRIQNFGDDGIALLPKTLTHLDLPGISAPTNACIPHLPHRLTYLTLVSANNMTVDCIHSLPKGIVHLHLYPGVSAGLEDHHMPLLNPDMKNFSLKGSKRLTEACLPDVPPKLLQQRHILPDALVTALALQQVLSMDQSLTTIHWPHWILQRVNDNFVPTLPRVLQTLHWADVNLSGHSFAQLPPSLTAISLPQTTGLTDAAISVIPRTVRVLRIPKCANITDAGLENLPPNLEALDLSMNRNISDQGIQCLQKTALRELSLRTNDKVSAQGAKFLPRSLTKLDLAWNKNFNDESIRDLPPNLTELNLSSAKKITNEACPHFPKTLKRLIIKDAHLITSEGAQHLKHVIYLSTYSIQE